MPWVLLPLLLLGGQALARDWYFSDCATRGWATGCWQSAGLAACKNAGDKANPYCPDPDGDGTRDFIAYLQDGAAPDAVAGDKITMCAGACGTDAVTSATIGVHRTAPNPPSTHKCLGNTWFMPKVNNLSVLGFPGETIVITGNPNGNTTQDPGEPGVLIGQANGFSGLLFKDFTLEESGVHWFCLLDQGAPGWTLDHLVLKENTPAVWNDTDGIATGAAAPGPGTCKTQGTCQCGAGASSSSSEYGIYLGHQGTNKFTLKNSIVSASCGSAMRIVANDASAQADGLLSFEIIDNEFFNVPMAVEFWKTHNIRIAGNYVHDADRAFGPENGVSYVDIEHNRIECRGDYTVQLGGECAAAIALESGDGAQALDHTAHHVRIRGNTIVAANVGPTQGHFRAGITLDGPRCDTGHPKHHPGCTFASDPGNLIENNVVALVTLPSASNAKPHEARGAIGVKAYNPIVVRNNTIFGATYGLTLQPAGPGATIAAFNNLVDTIQKAADGSPGIGIILMPEMVAQEASLTYNNVFSSGKGNYAVRQCATLAYDECANFGTSCAFGSSLKPCLSSPTNKSARSVFVNPGCSIDRCDLHLSPLDSSNLNAGTTGPALDIDKQARPQQGKWDIGADEAPADGPAGGG
jgi:hypothetical protein